VYLFIPGVQISESVCFFHILSGMTCSGNFKHAQERPDSRNQHGEENYDKKLTNLGTGRGVEGGFISAVAMFTNSALFASTFA